MFLSFLFALIAVCPHESAAQTKGYIYPFAGDGIAGFSGDSGAATSAKLDVPQRVATDQFGNVFIADEENRRIRVVNSSGTISTYVGNGNYGFSGDNGPATSASLSSIGGMAVDSNGNLYFTDQANNRVRRVDVNSPHNITTVVGNGTAGDNGDNGLASAATVDSPSGIAFDAAGDYVISDASSHIREISAATGKISTIAGNGGLGVSGNGGSAYSAECAANDTLAFDLAGDLFLGESANYVVRKISATTQIISVYAGIANTDEPAYSSGQPATSVGLQSDIFDVKTDGYNVYISYDEAILEVNYVSNIISTVAGEVGVEGYSGDSGPAIDATFSVADGIALNSAGTLYIADSLDARVRYIYQFAATPPGIVFTPSPVSFSTVAGTTSASQLVTVTNETGVNLTNFSLTDSDATNFLRTSTTCTASFTAGANCTFELACLTDNVGTTPGSITGAGGGYSSTLPLSCTSALGGRLSYVRGTTTVTQSPPCTYGSTPYTWTFTDTSGGVHSFPYPTYTLTATGAKQCNSVQQTTENEWSNDNMYYLQAVGDVGSITAYQ